MQGMTYNPDKHHRRSIRLKGYDYTRAGAYLVTVVVHDRHSLFGDVADEKMRSNDAVKVGEASWLDIPNHFPRVDLDLFVVIPNHIHGIIWIVDDDVWARHTVHLHLPCPDVMYNYLGLTPESSAKIRLFANIEEVNGLGT